MFKKSFLLIFILYSLIAFSQYTYRIDDINYYFNENNLGLTIENDNYNWSSVLETEDRRLNKIWSNFFRNAITIEYVTDSLQIKKMSINSENSTISYKTYDNKIDINVINELGFEINIIYELEKDGFVISIPTIKENSINRIVNLYVLPFFEGTKNEDEGYMFVPDGTGTLIYLKKKEYVKQPFKKKVYGEDIGIINQSNNMFSTLSPNIIMPVYGMVKKDKGFFSIIENGAEYAEINAYIPGIISNYFWITSKFEYRKIYKKILDLKGNGVLAISENINPANIKIRYYLLQKEDANYSSMAKIYRDYLIKKGFIERKEVQDNIPIKIEFLIADNEKNLIGKKEIIMTKNINGILDDLNIDNRIVVLKGFNKGGYYGSSPKHLPFIKGIKDIIKDDNIYLFVDYLKAFKESSGYRKSDIALNISRKIIENNNNYFLKPDSAIGLYKKEKNSFDKANLVFNSIGTYTYSYYNNKKMYSRTDFINEITKIFDKKSSFNFPAFYIWEFAENIFNVPLENSNYLIEDVAVPFLSIVVKNYINLFSESLNNFSDLDFVLLKLIEYNLYPSFYLTEESLIKLVDSRNKEYISSKYENWKDKIVKIYNMLNDVMKELEGFEVLNHNIIDEGVIELIYSNGVKIYINYTNKEYKYNNLEIPSMSYLKVIS